MRLYDRLCWKIGLPPMPVIDASSIADAIDALPVDVPRYPSSSYGIVAPPFHACFVEATTVGESGAIVGQRGVLFRATTDRIHPTTPDRTRWTLTLEAFMSIKGQGTYGYQQLAVVFLDRQGKIINDMLKGVPLLPNPTQYAKIGQSRVPGAALHCVYSLKAINAMHLSCPAEHLTPTDDERRHYQRKAGAGSEPTEYYLLKVRPRAKGGFETIGHGQAEEPRRAHVVRGHFKYYDPERPMFGQAGKHGMIWIPDHTRGDAERGSIAKGYQVQPPAHEPS
ncbi:hypothetical protein [Herpetosiphon geysericola]|uniref:Uncharacterized protein n=1 Tax=Herpetosiphon geysericola TaxID=70996 RepID=A0A0P6Y1U0_9CHLR|nr:hypothetical protein [Herpetosiphon geysericola]KPL83054.1 hypothetical protein SE18_19635 [Herpetosiphon geysericola]